MRRLAEAVPPTFFREAAAEHDAAVARSGASVHDLRFADRRVQLRFAGLRLADALLGALAPRLETRAGAVDAIISLWDGHSCGESTLPVPWRDIDVDSRGLVRGPNREQVVGVYESGSGAFTLVDLRAVELLHRVPSAPALPWWERAAPLCARGCADPGGGRLDARPPRRL